MSRVEFVPDDKRETVSRRDFLRVGGLSVVGLSVAEQSARAATLDATDRRSCILILMNGGASHIESFDPKPQAPVEIRGPLKAVSTSMPGVAFSESLPMLAQRAEKLAIIRSLYHDAAAIHESGAQLLQTGRLARGGRQYPSYGSVIARCLGPRDDVAPYVVLPRLIRDTGVHSMHGQGAGCLGPGYEPLVDEPVEEAAAGNESLESFAGLSIRDEAEAVRRSYGETRFGRLCLLARKLVESGVRCVTINLFDGLTGRVTWDCHGRKPWAPATLYDYRDTLCPQFDRALSALIDDLEQRGLLDDTLVAATGEFGRTPHINDVGGRDHWPHVFSAVLAGGGVAGGHVLGASDRYGREPVDRATALPELTATLYRALGLDLDSQLTLEDGTELPLVEHACVEELFA